MACSTSFEAMIADSVAGECLSDGRKRTTLLSDRLRHYAEVPGLPRLIYAMHAPTSDKRYANTVSLVIADQDLGDMDVAMFCRFRMEFIIGHVDLSSLKLSPKRREMVLEALKLPAEVAPPK